MIHLSSYHSNGLPTVVWSNKVNLIGEKVYKPKIHFCEHCNKPILIYGRLIPCKHVFCFTCATLCLTQPTINNSLNSASSLTPPLPGPSEPVSLTSSQPPPLLNPSSQSYNRSPHNVNNTNSNLVSNSHQQMISEKHHPSRNSRANHSNKNLNLYRSDSNHSLLQRETNSSDLSNMDESNSVATPNTIQQDGISSPNLNGGSSSSIAQQQQLNQLHFVGKGCHRCGGKALRVERNTLNSIFVCQVDSCKRSYLSARDLQAHVAHRHSRNKANSSNNTNTINGAATSAAAISSSPYISSSTLLHLNNHNQTNSSVATNLRQSSTNSNSNATSNPLNSHTNSPNNHHHRRDREVQHHHGSGGGRDRYRDRDRERDRTFPRVRDNYQRDRERERDSKEYHRQSLQRAAQWAEASAQMLEKGLTR